ncbi:lipoate protein ligase C-terminal domain-containing protein, partial [Chromobacterium piscinae]
MISRCQIFSDSLNPAPLEALATQLQGVAYRPDTLAAAVAQLKTAWPAQHEELTQLESWLTASVR